MDHKPDSEAIALRLLELYAGQENGRDLGPFKLDNELRRTLAHLAATNGVISRLLTCDASDKLLVSDTAVAALLAQLGFTTGKLNVYDAATVSALTALQSVTLGVKQQNDTDTLEDASITAISGTTNIDLSASTAGYGIACIDAGLLEVYRTDTLGGSKMGVSAILTAGHLYYVGWAGSYLQGVPYGASPPTYLAINLF